MEDHVFVHIGYVEDMVEVELRVEGVEATSKLALEANMVVDELMEVQEVQ